MMEKTLLAFAEAISVDPGVNDATRAAAVELAAEARDACETYRVFVAATEDDARHLRG